MRAKSSSRKIVTVAQMFICKWRFICHSLCDYLSSLFSWKKHSCCPKLDNCWEHAQFPLRGQQGCHKSEFVMRKTMVFARATRPARAVYLILHARHVRFSPLVHSFSSSVNLVVCETTTWNDKIESYMEDVSTWSLNFTLLPRCLNRSCQFNLNTVHARYRSWTT